MARARPAGASLACASSSEAEDEDLPASSDEEDAEDAEPEEEEEVVAAWPAFLCFLTRNVLAGASKGAAPAASLVVLARQLLFHACKPNEERTKERTKQITKKKTVSREDLYLAFHMMKHTCR